MASNGRGWRQSPRRLFASVLAAGLGLSSAASAEPGATERETARGLMAEGRSDRENGDLQDALRAFLGADAIMHVPTTGLEVARTQAALGLLVEAWNTALRVSRTIAKAGEPAPFERARQAAVVLEGELEARVPSLTEAAGEAPRRDPGASSASSVAAATAEGGTATEAVPTPVPTGSRGPGTSRALIVGGFGLAGAGLVAGAVSGALSLSKTGDVKSSGGCAGTVCGPTEYGDIGAARSMATFSTWSFVAAGAGVVLAVLGLATSASSSSPPAGATPEKAAPDERAGHLSGWLGWKVAGVRGTF